MREESASLWFLRGLESPLEGGKEDDWSSAVGKHNNTHQLKNKILLMCDDAADSTQKQNSELEEALCLSAILFSHFVLFRIILMHMCRTFEFLCSDFAPVFCPFVSFCWFLCFGGYFKFFVCLFVSIWTHLSLICFLLSCLQASAVILRLFFYMFVSLCSSCVYFVPFCIFVLILVNHSSLVVDLPVVSFSHFLPSLCL